MGPYRYTFLSTRSYITEQLGVQCESGRMLSFQAVYVHPQSGGAADIRVASIQFQCRFRLPESGVGTVAATSIYPLRRLVLAMRFGQAPRIGSQRSDFA